MCEVNAYLRKDNHETLIMERVYKLESTENQIRIENLFGEQKFISVPLKEVDFDQNRMVFVDPKKTP